MFGFLFPVSGGRYRPGITAGEARMISEDADWALEQRLQALELACAGLWQLLQAKHGYSEDELIAAIHEVDARDGTVDGKAERGPEDCPRCGRRLLARNSRKCSWCGAETARPFTSG